MQSINKSWCQGISQFGSEEGPIAFIRPAEYEGSNLQADRATPLFRPNDTNQKPRRIRLPGSAGARPLRFLDCLRGREVLYDLVET